MLQVVPKEGSFLDLIERREVEDLDDDGNPRTDLNGDVIMIEVDHEVRTE